MGMSRSEGANDQPKPAIVLVHGAFADASGWADVIRTLQAKGYDVIAVQNPLSSYADDVATTKRLIDAQKGPVVVVAHSYGGAVISGAAAGTRTSRRSCTSPPSRPTWARRSVRSSRSIRQGRRRLPSRCGGIPLHRSRPVPRRVRPGSPRGGDQRDGGDAEAVERIGVRGDADRRRMEERADMVHRRAGGSRDQSGSRALLREADGREDDGTKVEPRRVHVAPGCRSSQRSTRRREFRHQRGRSKGSGSPEGSP